jgi:hemolysin activation/secretion protein
LGPVARELAFSLFHDWAHVKFSKDAALQPAGVSNTGTLSATGLGLIWDRPGDMAFRMDLAWRGAGDALADPKDHSPRANLVLTKRF